MQKIVIQATFTRRATVARRGGEELRLQAAVARGGGVEELHLQATCHMLGKIRALVVGYRG